MFTHAVLNLPNANYCIAFLLWQSKKKKKTTLALHNCSLKNMQLGFSFEN